MAYTGKFNLWWRGINSHPEPKRTEIIENWLKYACKTVAIRCDSDQQRVVYTIANRYRNSTYKRLTRKNARRVFAIINSKQQAHRRQLQEIRDLKARLERYEGKTAYHHNTEKRTTSKRAGEKATIITKKKTRKYISGGSK